MVDTQGEGVRVNFADAMRLHGVHAHAARVAARAYTWQVTCGERKRSGELRLYLGEGELPGDTPEELGAAVLERIAGIAWVVEAHLEGAPPSWLSEEEWGAACDLAEDLRRAASHEAIRALFDAEDEGIPHAESEETP